jgi:spermidine synthase
MVSKEVHSAVLLFLFFLSGACALIYEVLWMRSFTSAFGVTVYATSVILAAFMAGLALGSYLFGRWAEHRGSPLRIYAYLEVGIGVYALLMPFLLDQLPSFYKLIYGHWSDNLSVTLIVRFAAAFMVLLVPTTLMGATLPVLCKCFAPEKSRVGKESGRLYALNTFGAVTGTLFAGFILIPQLGVSRTNSLAAFLNLLIGFLVLAVGDRFKMPIPTRASAKNHVESRRKRREKERAVIMNGNARWILPLIAVSGYAALSYEVIWTKILSIITFNTVFAFTSMLATFLTGIALGGYVYTKALDRRKNPWTWFAALQFGIGAYALLSPLLFADLATYFYRFQIAAALSNPSWESFVLKQFLLAGLIMLFPTLLMGASFPLACKIYANATGKTAAGVGDVYGSNTLGAIGGSAVTGLIFIPVLGLKGGLMIAASLNLLAGAVALHLGSPGGVGRWYRVAGLAPILAVLFLFVMNVDVAFTHVARDGREIIFHQEDATGVVEVFQEHGKRFLVTNRLHSEGSNLPDAVYLQRKQGYLPLLLHPNPESVIEIGLGTGIGFTPVVLYDKVKHAEMVEISPGVVKAAALFAQDSQHVLEHPKLKLKVDDGRNYLLLTPNTYDLIILGLFTPYRSGVGYLYTKEFYLQCKEKLKEKGMVVQWLALSQLSLDNLKIIINTFQSVFPYVYALDKGYYLALVGLDQELKLDMKRIHATLGSASIRADLQSWGLDNPYQFLASFFMGPEEAKEFADGAPINTEDRLWIEFSNVKAFKAAYSLDYAVKNLVALLEYRRAPFRHLENVKEVERVKLERAFDARRYSLQGLIYQGRRMHQRAYEYFRRAERTDAGDDISRFALQEYHQAMK